MSNPCARPLPVVTALNRGFWDHARAGRLAVQVCRDCGNAHFPDSPVCPECLGDAQAWQPVSGVGTLESWVEFHRAYWPGFSGALPYVACLVRLAEGPVLVSNLIGGLEKAKHGAPVHVVFEKLTEEITLPKFALD